MKLVGFDADQQKQLSTYQMQKSPIKIRDCQIQRLSYTGDLEIKFTPKSSMEKSPTKVEPSLKLITSEFLLTMIAS